MANDPNEGGPPRKRFAPVPIETTYESVRKAPQIEPGGHMSELTPEPSPRGLSPVRAPASLSRSGERRVKRRFAPQLIETSRRARRVGDTGPATRPTDKTDITPYTNHIYAAKNKTRRKLADDDEGSSPVQWQRQPKGARRESEDENAGDMMLEWAAIEAERQLQEVALAAFPNSRPREGGAAHFYYRESSGDDTTSSSTSPAPGDGTTLHKIRGGKSRPIRRKSSDVGYWHKYMQDHAEKLAGERDEAAPKVPGDMEPEVDEPHADEDIEMDDDDLDKMELEGPPDPLWTTSRRSSMPGPKGPIGETYMPLMPSADVQKTKEARFGDEQQPVDTGHPVTEPPRPLDTHRAQAMAQQTAGNMRYAPHQQVPPETGFRNVGLPFGRPFGAPGLPRNAGHLLNMRKAAAPPMLGKDLWFRRCPSPKLTKLEPSHPFRELHMPEETNRDKTGNGGLWRGYCFRGSGDEENIVPPELRGPQMLATPLPPASPGDPFEQSFQSHTARSSGDASVSTGTEHRPRSGEAKGVHMLQGLEERLRREKAEAEREERIANEFNDTFITQVYNYLSLGYPATAHVYDDELSKISHMDIDEIESDDANQMATGHIVEAKPGPIPETQRCPRWRALKTYILEWARQHPNLDDLDPLAWGMRERRGSWAI